ncbi:MAG: hypothetical protein EPN58_17260 [Rhodanobacter sp.]|nr:MAG: hypothetical protein EPN58_17260 [Rhodanobacter sp.]
MPEQFAVCHGQTSSNGLVRSARAEQWALLFNLHSLPSFASNPLEFEGIGVWAAELFPDPEKQHDILVPQRLFDQGAATIKASDQIHSR